VKKIHVIDRVEELIEVVIKKKGIALQLYRKMVWDF
jgi:hypothetical protein